MQWLIDIITDWIIAQGYLTACFVWRGGTGFYDFVLGDFALDNAWHDFDLSAIVPSNAKAVLLSVDLRCTVAEKRIDFRRSAADQTWSVATIRTQAANVRYAAPAPVSLDSNRVCQYKVNHANFNVVNVTVVGWWF